MLKSALSMDDNKFRTQYSALIEAKRIEDLSNDKNFLPVYVSSTAKILPYQIAAARFALRSDFLNGCILCDEGSLGKTYEALFIAGQKWFEGKENILIILPPILLHSGNANLTQILRFHIFFGIIQKIFLMKTELF